MQTRLSDNETVGKEVQDERISISEIRRCVYRQPYLSRGNRQSAQLIDEVNKETQSKT